MDVHAEVQLDTHDINLRGAAITQWFKTFLHSPFFGSTPPEASWIAGLARNEGDPLEFFEGRERIQDQFMGELADSPYAARLVITYGETEIGKVSSTHTVKSGQHSRLLTTLQLGSGLADPQRCGQLVDTVTEALDAADPAFGRIDHNQFSERANLDIALRRKTVEYLSESRRLLRGYAWTTVCPQELVDRLGGMEALRATGAFSRVVPLRRGAVLQSTDAVAAYTDEAMHAVFETLAPVLPPGLPKRHPAFPDTRFVPRDAREVHGAARP